MDTYGLWGMSRLAGFPAVEVWGASGLVTDYGESPAEPAIGLGGVTRDGVAIGSQAKRHPPHMR